MDYKINSNNEEDDDLKYLTLQKCYQLENYSVFQNKQKEFYFISTFILLLYLCTLLLDNYFNKFGPFMINIIKYDGFVDIFKLVNNENLNNVKFVLILFSFNNYNLFFTFFLIYFDSIGIVVDSIIKLVYNINLVYLNYTSFLLIITSFYFLKMKKNNESIFKNTILILFYCSIFFLILFLEINSFDSTFENKENFVKFILISCGFTFIISFIYFKIYDYEFESYICIKQFYNSFISNNTQDIIFFLLFYLVYSYLMFNKSNNSISQYNLNNTPQIFFFIGSLFSQSIEYNFIFYKNFYLFSKYNLSYLDNSKKYIFNNTSIKKCFIRMLIMISVSIIFKYITNIEYLNKLYIHPIINFSEAIFLFFFLKQIFIWRNINLLNDSLFETLTDSFDNTRINSLDNYYLLVDVNSFSSNQRIN